MTDPITAGLDAFAALTTLVGKSLPSDAERLKRIEINHPWLYARALKRAENQKRKQAKIKMQALIDAANFAHKNGVAPQELANYLYGDTTQADMIRKIMSK